MIYIFAHFKTNTTQMKKNNLLFFLFFVFPLSIIAQNETDIKKIVSSYDLDKIKEREAFFKKKEDTEKQKAIVYARNHNLPIRKINEDGSISELMKVTPNGFPIYYATDNANAAKSTRANHLNTGGSLGLDLNGQGMTARVWDGGTVRASHTLFSGRVSVVDQPSSTSYVVHSTHVTGTIMASNAAAATKGMAYQASARTFEWTNDLSEVMSEVQQGMLISNHSYGTPVTSNSTTLPAWYIGAYTSDARDWDEAAYLSPYYLMVASAGNDGTNNNNANPIAFGYDKLTTNKVCKNNLVVANAQDAVVATNGNLTSVAINSSSSQGPTDDMRIKPDITGNGTSVTSTSSESNTATATLTGTSMASPNVAGTLLLLQQHYKNLTNSFMRSATLKGLACHTADDSGMVGPDPIFGWGLLNAKKAAETLTGNGLTSWVSEENLTQGQTYTMTVKSDGTTPLMASVTWTDVPGNPIMDDLTENDPTPRLVNDLDIRITKDNTTYYPWRLDIDPSSPAVRDGDNNVDNVELVKIDNPSAGIYTISITHKGTLVGGNQNYSLVVTGISSTFSLTSTTPDLTVCSDQTAAYTFTYKQTGSGTTTFSAEGLPAGATASFNNNSLNANGTVTMTISGLTNVAPGDYYIGIKGTSATETETRFKKLRIYSSAFQNVVLTSPTNSQNGLSTTVNLKWDNQSNAESYTVQVSTLANFSSMDINETVTTNQFTVTGLNQQTRYYWRVIPSNRCGNATATTAAIYSFDTGVVVCGSSSFSATNFSNAAISSSADSSASVPITITGGYTIGDLNVRMNITHTYVEDMTISLIGPASIGSPKIILLKEPCGDNDNINCTMDDSGGVPTCSGNPSISGSIAPYDSLSSLNTLPADGVWTLSVVDPYNGDGGTINSFAIDLCYVLPANLSTTANVLANVTIYPNPTKGIINISLPEMNDKTVLTLHDIQGRAILSKTTDNLNEVLNIENLQEGVYLLSLENGTDKTTKKVILNK
ncbi:T9SS type A sorting domain-containing protein [Flavobacterium silvisoli]|uniref:T9SS type A sorting domain-containing protein n=2 Tax=Flavobacterium silvisoli TaxID=2529433 RepID=A0A4Q9Z725_9FLAO|nr:T9SS type A sorting domain-containing protein [Flavobacterium silvisoli]